MKRNQNITQTVLITGGSSGIGLALAKKWAAAGADLILVARSEAALEVVKKELSDEFGVEVRVVVADLSTAADLEKVVELIEKSQIDVLVNNAGFGSLGEFETASWDKYDSMIALNITALTRLAQAVLPQMKQRKSGQIVLLGSIAGFFPGPLMAVYYASKAYVVSLGVALSSELKDIGVKVTTVCPGPTQTGFAQAADASGSALFNGQHVMTVEQVAAQAYQAAVVGKTLMVTGFMNKVLVLMGRWLPMEWVAELNKKLQG